jgi:hypothetical protein
MERLSMEIYPSFFRGSTLVGGGMHLEEEGRTYRPSFSHEERRTCQIRLSSDALGEESLGACFCGERLSVSGSFYLL